MPKIKERRALTPEEQTTLEKLSRSQKAESRLVERAKIVLWSRNRISGNQIAIRLGRKSDTMIHNLWKKGGNNYALSDTTPTDSCDLY